MRLIDADALKEAFEIAYKEAWHDREYSNAFFSDGGAVSTEWWCVEDMVDNAPTIEPQKWSSIENKLPENNADVLLQFKSNMGVGFWEDGDWAINTGDGIYSLLGYEEEKPIAWMPLPEPWKEEEE